MYTNSSATLYMKTPAGYERVILQRVFWDGSNRKTFLKTGLANANAVTIFVPRGVWAEGREFVETKKFEAFPSEEAHRFFTFHPGDYIVKGICHYRYSETHPIRELIGKFDNVHVITSVDYHDQGSRHMWHWEIAGK